MKQVFNKLISNYVLQLAGPTAIMSDSDNPMTTILSIC